MALNCNRWKVGQFSTLSLAIVAGLLAAVLYFYIPNVIQKQINEKAVLSEDEFGNYSDTTKSWKDPKYDMAMSVYTFSVLNAAEVESNNTRPRVVEKGPYVFDEVQHKRIQFAANDTRVFYRNYKYYFFNQNKSCDDCLLTDVVTVPNIVLQTIIDKIPNNVIIKGLVDIVLRAQKEKIFITATVGGLLFEGYEDPLISKICNSNPMVRAFCRAQKIPLKVGLFYGKNGTEDGLYEIGSGTGDISELSKVFTFNRKNHTDAYYGPKAQQIKGTDGQMFPPGINSRDSYFLDLFVGPLCRSIELERTGSRNYEGVWVYTYGPSRNMHDIDLQRGLGFCNPNSPRYFNNTYIQEKGCAPMGIMDVSSCMPGNPRIYISQPHFYGSHPAVHDAIDGLAPISDNDKTEIGIEPATSAVVYADQRTQLNLGVINGGLPSLSTVSPRIIPLIWLRDSASFDEGTKAQLSGLAGTKKDIFIASIGTFLFFCLSIVAFGVIFAVRSRQQESDTVPLLADEQALAEEPQEESA
ncbi:unnamed protein product [Bursaphelenchus xylophilus]|uniref:(pine wood nematode) hypothetical protein n=1 Tax=Bursaphelenchus xylophilus TaxID=6326 RepID=A0A1I7SQM4_BURXY|nr:unnamed protein product [Bursaphelenchus xylophilus]CAG9110103.1 unnamed protein product [Bursaphelenchus xylophilus]